MKPGKLRATGRGFFFCLLLYLFLLSIKLMGGGLELLGKEFVDSLFVSIRNPFVGLFVGIFATSVLQSSGATTSMVVGLLGSATAASVLDVGSAIPIIMGANIGTTVTNTIVSLAHITRREEFRRAFGGAIVHDLFNVLTVIVLFPLECYTHILQRLAEALSAGFSGVGGVAIGKPICAITEPVVNGLRYVLVNVLKLEAKLAGFVMLIFAGVILLAALTCMVRLAKRAVVGRVEAAFDFLFSRPGRALLFGTLLTALVQSSSITTSLVVPLVGAGILTLEQIYPYTLGANMGTTVRTLIAALATVSVGANPGLTIAFSHLLFNLLGFSIFYPLRVIPISLARGFANQVARRRVYAVVWLAVCFYGVPLILIFISRRFYS